MIARAMETSGAKPFIVAGVKGLWLAFSFHLIVLAVVVLVVSRDQERNRLFSSVRSSLPPTPLFSFILCSRVR
jgi:hypothetical protein